MNDSDITNVTGIACVLYIYQNSCGFNIQNQNCEQFSLLGVLAYSVPSDGIHNLQCIISKTTLFW